jgi:glycosyltransferase involved in cell wall biosynthesis
MAKSSPLFEGCEVRCIPYGIDLNEFVPRSKPEARHALSIPREAKVIMIVAFEDKVEGARRKGADYFKQALQSLNLTPRPWILAVGGKGVFDEVKERFPVREVGYLRSALEMSRCYTAADVFVLPTLADNLPISLIEAAATGTPSVGFDIGGVPDVLRHGETGYVATYQDPEDLARGIGWVLADDRRRLEISRHCRARAEREYSLKLQVSRYVDLYGLAREKATRCSPPH